jgi:cyclophilin family peptidyl-prolyl cis-trans isomerase
MAGPQEFGMPEAGNTLTLDTTQGQVVIEMRPDLAPAHVAHIKKLVAGSSTTASFSTA